MQTHQKSLGLRHGDGAIKSRSIPRPPSCRPFHHNMPRTPTFPSPPARTGPHPVDSLSRETSHCSLPRKPAHCFTSQHPGYPQYLIAFVSPEKMEDAQGGDHGCLFRGSLAHTMESGLIYLVEGLAVSSTQMTSNALCGSGGGRGAHSTFTATPKVAIIPTDR